MFTFVFIKKSSNKSDHIQSFGDSKCEGILNFKLFFEEILIYIVMHLFRYNSFY